jgi:hypothetical protein
LSKSIAKMYYKGCGCPRAYVLTTNVLIRAEKYSRHRITFWPPNTVHRCSRQDVVAAWLTSERPGSVIPVSKTLILLGIHS